MIMRITEKSTNEQISNALRQDGYSALLGRKVSRAATIRAIVSLVADRLPFEDVPGLAGLFALDKVRRGRVPARKGGAAAASPWAPR